MVIGAGGLGSAVIQYIAAAGVGTIGIVDDDQVSLSNLQRQIIHDTNNIGLAKTESVRLAVHRLNPHVKVELLPFRIDDSNAAEFIASYDIVADGSDNFTTRYLVADACEIAKKILVFAAVSQFDGSVTTLKPHEKNIHGNPYPRYRDWFPVKPEDGLLSNCAEIGILGALSGVIGTIQAVEIIKELLAIGESLAGTLLMYDAKSARFISVRYSEKAGPGCTS